eukprot:CAMPEP_0184868098 /NCGR_PEP_ID=MMETSP0580-20130426/29156_1 /TAXON_ID=1118495 /ORGANISM="Dactyliosolen fragilissimus" /LENGTH=268 /DNA_ID=CAMNT_0027368763 /DNA_START=163 /DNA_END=969 /DNA_ORIENTATION=-
MLQGKQTIMPQNRDLVIFTTTFYTSVDDIRYHMCISTIREAVARSIPIVIVDASPSDEVFSGMIEAGAMVYKQTGTGRKGVGLREAAIHAKQLDIATDDTYLCFQEPEKKDMIRHWVVALGQGNGADVIMPFRLQSAFLQTYPIEQYHSETFGNLYMDACAREALEKTNSPLVDTYTGLDWHFGPFSLRAKHLSFWTRYKGDMYDAQLVPIIHAMRSGLSVQSVTVDYAAPLEMKDQEQGNVTFIEKRWNQILELDPRLKQAWKDTLP